MIIDGVNKMKVNSEGVIFNRFKIFYERNRNIS